MTLLRADATGPGEDARISTVGLGMALESESVVIAVRMDRAIVPFLATVEAFAETLRLLGTFASEMPDLVAAETGQLVHRCRTCDEVAMTYMRHAPPPSASPVASPSPAAAKPFSLELSLLKAAAPTSLRSPPTAPVSQEGALAAPASQVAEGAASLAGVKVNRARETKEIERFTSPRSGGVPAAHRGDC
ncbi:MAG: hypothetical protein L6R39_002273 [Caloplaca ligustica]|nr:MAG: hypothetical protein L6R39_002273 [Caloplaca ligustica]